MDILAHARRRAFSLWLRTGRLPSWARPRSAELKYNPWHDPDDGRFTHAGTGRYFGRGSSQGGAGRSSDARMSDEPREKYGGYGGGGRGFNGGGAGGSWDEPRPASGRGFNGGGAGGSWDEPAREAQPTRDANSNARQTAERPRRDGRARPRRVLDDPRNWRSETANGYEWKLDATELPREITGVFTLGMARRSKTAQRQAGRPDRRSSDDGGHFVGVRFNPPTAPYNHFAQDSNFNRGRWRTLEDEWASEAEEGKVVEFKIVPVYPPSSRRPSHINVWWWVDGEKKSLKFHNEPQGRKDAKR